MDEAVNHHLCADGPLRNYSLTHNTWIHWPI